MPDTRLQVKKKNPPQQTSLYDDVTGSRAFIPSVATAGGLAALAGAGGLGYRYLRNKYNPIVNDSSGNYVSGGGFWDTMDKWKNAEGSLYNRFNNWRQSPSADSWTGSVNNVLDNGLGLAQEGLEGATGIFNNTVAPAVKKGAGYAGELYQGAKNLGQEAMKSVFGSSPVSSAVQAGAKSVIPSAYGGQVPRYGKGGSSAAGQVAKGIALGLGGSAALLGGGLGARQLYRNYKYNPKTPDAFIDPEFIKQNLGNKENALDFQQQLLDPSKRGVNFPAQVGDVPTEKYFNDYYANRALGDLASGASSFNPQAMEDAAKAQQMAQSMDSAMLAYGGQVPRYSYGGTQVPQYDFGGFIKGIGKSMFPNAYGGLSKLYDWWQGTPDANAQKQGVANAAPAVAGSQDVPAGPPKKFSEAVTSALPNLAEYAVPLTQAASGIYQDINAQKQMAQGAQPAQQVAPVTPQQVGGWGERMGGALGGIMPYLAGGPLGYGINMMMGNPLGNAGTTIGQGLGSIVDWGTNKFNNWWNRTTPQQQAPNPNPNDISFAANDPMGNLNAEDAMANGQTGGNINNLQTPVPNYQPPTPVDNKPPLLTAPSVQSGPVGSNLTSVPSGAKTFSTQNSTIASQPPTQGNLSQPPTTNSQSIVPQPNTNQGGQGNIVPQNNEQQDLNPANTSVAYGGYVPRYRYGAYAPRYAYGGYVPRYASGGENNSSRGNMWGGAMAGAIPGALAGAYMGRTGAMKDFIADKALEAEGMGSINDLAELQGKIAEHAAALKAGPQEKLWPMLRGGLIGSGLGGAVGGFLGH